MWAMVQPDGPDGMKARLGASSGPLQAQVDGFRLRALRAQAPAQQRHLYVTGWIALTATEEAEAPTTLVIGDVQLFAGVEQLASRVTKSELAEKLNSSEGGLVVVSTATQRGLSALVPLCALEVSLT